MGVMYLDKKILGWIFVSIDFIYTKQQSAVCLQLFSIPPFFPPLPDSRSSIPLKLLPRRFLPYSLPLQPLSPHPPADNPPFCSKMAESQSITPPSLSTCHLDAPEGAINNHTPSPSTISFLASLQSTFHDARSHGLCSIAAASYASTVPRPTLASFVPHPHNRPTAKSGPTPCPCAYEPDKPPQKSFQQHTCSLPAAQQVPPHDESSVDDDYAGEGETVISTLRNRLATLDDQGKIAACRERFMGRYKRSKTAELEGNIRTLFGRQYSPMTRPPPDSPEKEDEQPPLLGCAHYARNCKLKAKCCGLFVSCRFCHDEVMSEDHDMDRFATENILCMMCLTEQGVTDYCKNCGVSFAHWFCKHCRFYENTPGKKVYHCERCNICRLGEGLGIDNYHCDKCDACVALPSKEHHRCISKALHANCPVCRVYLFTSTEPVLFMRCGHTMHKECFDIYTSGSYQCPLCMRSLTNMKPYFRQIDELMRSEPMPPEYDHKRSVIFCNDCRTRSVVKYHFNYHKCEAQGCEGSYNTQLIKVFDVEPSPARSVDLEEEVLNPPQAGEECPIAEDGQFAKSPPLQWSVRG